MLSKNSDRTSLKRRFLKHFFWGTLVIWMTATAISYYVVSHELEEFYDGELAQTARVLLSIYTQGSINLETHGQVTSSAFEGGDNYERKLVFQIWDESGSLLIRSANAPLEPLTETIGEFQTGSIFENDIRILALQEPTHGYMVQVGQNMDFRSENVTETLEPLILIFLVAFPVSIVLINRGLSKGVDILSDLSEKITRRTEDNLTPIEDDNIPTEISGIVDSLNTLMKRVRDAFNRERQFIADASHELRTPLAGIKAQAQVALQNPEHSPQSLDRIIQGVDRTSNLANQLLTLSGVDSLATLENAQTVEIESLVKAVIEDMEEATGSKSQKIISQFDREVSLRGDESLLYTLIRNLVENASRYSPENTCIRIDCRKSPGAVTVSIEDQGPGIPMENRERVFDRFFRDVDFKQNGSGLGLAIVRQIASLHKAVIKLHTGQNGSGLKVVVSFDVT